MTLNQQRAIESLESTIRKDIEVEKIQSPVNKLIPVEEVIKMLLEKELPTAAACIENIVAMERKRKKGNKNKRYGMWPEIVNAIVDEFSPKSIETQRG